MQRDLEWFADVGEDYLHRVAPLIQISAERNWPAWYPTHIKQYPDGSVRKMWAHTSTAQLKAIKEAYNGN